MKTNDKGRAVPSIYTPQDLSLSDTNMLTTNQLKFLYSPTPENQVYKRPAKGGGTWDYVKGSFVKKTLNLMFGFDWDFIIDDYKFDIAVGQAFVKGHLIVRNGDRVIEKHQFGRHDIQFKTEDVLGADGKPIYKNGKKLTKKTNVPLDIGNDLKSASTDCLKKCASELGLFSDVYSKEETKIITIMESEEIEVQLKEYLNDDTIHLSPQDIAHIEDVIESRNIKELPKLLYKLRKMRAEQNA